MNKSRLTIICAIISLFSLLLSGCWNYHEINDLTLVSGMAIDKLPDGRYHLTFEWVEPTGGKEGKTLPKIIHSDGYTIFDAVRNAIKISGKKLYFSHTKLVVVSQDIAKTGISPALDWITRDAEPRVEIYLAISKEKTAGEILSNTDESSKSIRSYDIYNILKTQSSVAKSSNMPVYRLINTLLSESNSTTLPVVGIGTGGDKKVLDVTGAAVLKGDKYVGLLDEDETKYLLFIRNRIKNPLLVEMVDSKSFNITLEVFKSNTKLTPVYRDNKLSINIKIDTEAALAEIYDGVDFSNEYSRSYLIKQSEEHLERDIINLVKKVQNNYGVDIFGFAILIKSDIPSTWKFISKDWEKVYRKLDVNVDSNIKIRNEGISGKPLMAGG